MTVGTAPADSALTTMGLRTVTVICPVYNEEKCVDYFYGRLKDAIADLEGRIAFQLLFVNNASTDATYATIQALRARDPSVQVLSHSRNFGYQASIISGLTNAVGDAFVIIDVDCEDPPEMIRDFVRHWEDGYDIVYGLRAARPEAAALVGMRKLFYRLTHAIADVDFIVDMAEFSLFTARVRRQVLRHHSTYPFVRSDLAFVGFRRLGLPYTREPRRFGETHYNLVRMTKFAVGGILSTSTFPLRILAYIGLPLAAANAAASLFSAIGLAGDLRWLALLNWSFLCGALAFLGIYLARVSKDVTGRPVFIVDRDRTELNGRRVREWHDREAAA
jgi:dolichol-phosphate mannosyltransferase